MTEITYPSLKVAADKASSNAQAKFLWLTKIQLFLLCANGFIAGWNPSLQQGQKLAATVVAVIMFVTLGISLAIQLGKFDDRWFKCRAYAENIKSVAWFYMISPERVVAEKNYLQEAKRIEERFPDLYKEFVVYDDGSPIISDVMRSVQSRPLKERIQIYRDARLEDQLRWYTEKAKYNARREKAWFWPIFVLELVAIAYAAMQIATLWEFNAVGGISAVIAALVGWAQTKRFSDLATSYSIAAGDLRRIRDECQTIDDDNALQNFAKNVETAISREHGIWVSHRMA